MEAVEIKLLDHHGPRLGIFFDRSHPLNGRIRSIPGIKWTRTHGCWHLADTPDNRRKLKQLLHAHEWAPGSVLPGKALQKKGMPAETNLAMSATSNQSPLSAGNLAALCNMENILRLKAYSGATIKTYKNEFSQLLFLLGNRPVDSLTPEHIRRYLLYAIRQQHLSENTLHSRINAIKFYFEQVLHRNKFFIDIPRPKKRRQDPHFFNQDEIAAIIRGTVNLKHRTLLMMAYSTGMRVSEVVALKVGHIDSRRMQIKIVQAKGKKDRVVVLSPVLLIMLREYYRHYKPVKDGYLFCGEHHDEPYSTRSIQLVLQAAKKRAGIVKAGSVHALRHSFATHLLDNGTDITMIMKLLGHNDLKTTLRYLHITNRDMLNIVSPLDKLDLGSGSDNSPQIN